VFDPLGSVTLWRLPSDIEDAFEARWEHWLDSASDWSAFFGSVATLDGSDLAGALQTLGLIDANDLRAFASLKSSAEGRAVAIPTPFSRTNAEVTLLALGFARGREGAPCVPYAKVGES
jgi:hypothetical protein